MHHHVNCQQDKRIKSQIFITLILLIIQNYLNSYFLYMMRGNPLPTLPLYLLLCANSIFFVRSQDIFLTEIFGENPVNLYHQFVNLLIITLRKKVVSSNI